MSKITLNKSHVNKLDAGRTALHLPHELDQMPDREPAEPQPVIRQAYDDLQRGLVDTDMHGDRGVEVVVKDTVKISIKKSRHTRKIK